MVKEIKIIILEDNPADARLLQYMISEWDDTKYTMNWFHCLEEGFVFLKDNRVDIVVLDLDLTDSTGLDTLHMFKKHFPVLPIIVLTGKKTQNIELMTARGGAQDFLEKGSFDGRLFKHALKFAIEQKKIENELTHHYEAENLINTISSTMMDTQYPHLYKVIKSLMKKILDFLRTDHVFILNLNEKFQTVSVLSETCSEMFGLENYQLIRSNNAYDYATGRLCKNYVVTIESHSKLPPKAMSMKQLMITSGIQSALFVPISSNGKIVAAFGLETLDDQKKWDKVTIGIIKVCGDLIFNTIEKKEKEKEILKLNKELKNKLLETNSQYDAFSYAITHDLRAPLRHINSYSMLIENHLSNRLDPKGLHYLKTIFSSSERLGRMLDNLLEFSRIERMPLRKKAININTLISSIVHDFRRQFAYRKIKWNIGFFPMIFADTHLMNYVFANLISNALKFSRDCAEPIITIGLDSNNDKEISFFIRDNGIGFQNKYASKIFETFQRLHDQKKYEGTGIGLSIVKRIIERHGGNIFAESALNKGTSIYITLPNSYV
jgi:signal transduction histidine kinase/FixJ family two-component response regulator